MDVKGGVKVVGSLKRPVMKPDSRVTFPRLECEEPLMILAGILQLVCTQLPWSCWSRAADIRVDVTPLNTVHIQCKMLRHLCSFQCDTLLWMNRTACLIYFPKIKTSASANLVTLSCVKETLNSLVLSLSSSRCIAILHLHLRCLRSAAKWAKRPLANSEMGENVGHPSVKKR